MTHVYRWCLLLAAFGQTRPSSSDGPDLCVVGPLKSPAFSAELQQLVPSYGCFSRRVTPRGQEVHVIRLAAKRGDRHRNQGRPLVTLNVQAPTDGRSHSREIIVVLDASTSVDWLIYGQNGFKNGTSFQIIVTRRSRVVHCDLTPVTVRSERVRSRQSLLRMVMSRLHAATSFTDVAAADTIDLAVGIDLAATDTCDTQDNLRPNAGLLPRRTRPVHLEGCYHRHLAGLGQRDVYAVEVTESAADFRDSKVVINLIGDGHRESAVDNLTLILKSAVPVTWQLTAQQYAGDILVLTENAVQNGSLDSAVSLDVHHVRLPKSFNDLIIFAVGYSSGPPVAYIRAPALSRLSISVGGNAGARPDGRPATELWHAPGQRRTASSDSMVPQTAYSADSVSGRLRHAVSVSCSAGRLVVAVPSSAADAVAVLALHLDDPACRSVHNGSHLVISRRLFDCDTQRRQHRDGTVYLNTVHFVSSQGPPDDEDLDGSGVGMEDDELDQTLPWQQSNGGSVPLSCQTSEEPPLPDDQESSRDIDEVGSSVYGLELSTEPDFSSAIDPTRVVPVPHTIYVRSSLHMASYLRPVVERCWVSQDGARTGPADLLLLRAACPALSTVTAPRPDHTDSTVFSFQVTPQLADLGHYYLHCRVGVCAGPDSPARQHIVQCLDDPDGHCFDVGDGRSPSDRLASGVQVITRGPLFSTVTEGAAASRRPVVQLGVSHQTVAGIGVSAFLLGVVLMGGVWLIHSKIGPAKRHHFRSVPQSEPHNPARPPVGPSADSTINSQTPIILAGRSPPPATV